MHVAIDRGIANVIVMNVHEARNQTKRTLASNAMRAIAAIASTISAKFDSCEAFLLIQNKKTYADCSQMVTDVPRTSCDDQ